MYARLIIIDTLLKVRTAADVSYGFDYNDLSLLKSFAGQHRFLDVLANEEDPNKTFTLWLFTLAAGMVSCVL